jgi:asparagine synthase (glutamine-hydrolysing)
VSTTKAAAVIETDGSIAQAFPVLRQLFSDQQRAELLGAERISEETDSYTALLEDAVARHPESGAMTLVSFAEARTYMHDVLLRDTDQMSMAHGLEVRVPLLDHHLVEFVMGLADDVKTPRDVPKQLLVESLGDLLPADCVMRPKQGFVLPFDQWMKSELRGICEHHLGAHGIAARGGLRLPALQSLWNQFLTGRSQVTWSRPWSIVALSAWAEQQDLQSG